MKLRPARADNQGAIARKDFQGRTRWRCERCHKAGSDVRETTWFRKNPRLYTFLTRGGSQERYATRVRPDAASQFHRGPVQPAQAAWHRQPRTLQLPLGQQERARAVAAGPALLAMTVRREAHETELYAAAANEAWALCLTKLRPPAPKVAGP